MKAEFLRKIFREELKAFFTSDDGKNIMADVVNLAMQRKITLEDGKSEPGRVIEKEIDCNILDFIAKYAPHTEGAVRGFQSDLAKHTGRIVALNKQMEKFIAIMEQPSPIVEVGNEGSGIFVDADRLPPGKIKELPKLNAGGDAKPLAAIPQKIDK